MDRWLEVKEAPEGKTHTYVYKGATDVIAAVNILYVIQMRFADIG